MARVNGPFDKDTWYHCYNRSVESRTAFGDAKDYSRFLEILYLANDTSPLRRHGLGMRSIEEIVMLPRTEEIVSLGAFCLMPAHFDLLVKERKPGGITTFMRKLGTAYTLYFNTRYAREGNLFLKPFRSIRVPTDRYASVTSYIHSHPAVWYEPQWKSGHVVDHQFVEEHLVAYPYSSLSMYYGRPSPLRALIDRSSLRLLESPTPIERLLRDARDYSSQYDLP